MAKKIRLDFSKVEERSGWKTTEMPEGLHEMKIELVDTRDANDGTAMLTYGLRPTNPKYKTRLFPYYCKLQANQLFKVRELHIAAGVLDPKKSKGKAVDIYPDAPIGKIIAAEVVDSSNPQYAGRSEIDGVYDRSIIDDEDQLADDEVDDDEIEDETDEVEDFEDDGDEESDDELREEIEALTLPALRKRAKALGIDTDGVKKDELIELVLEEELGGEDEDEEDEDEEDLDDEDLGDDELEDEDFEDDLEDDEEEEEEEPEPAPRRRTSSAKKAPAKAAPARRTVKRR